MRNDNDRRRNHRRNDGARPQRENNANANIADKQNVGTVPGNDEAKPEKPQEQLAKETGNAPKPQGQPAKAKGENGGKPQNGKGSRKDNNRRREKTRAKGERLLKDPSLEHSDDESEEDREYFDTMTPEELEQQHITPATVRLSIGTEHIDDIIEDLRQALERTEG